MDDDEKAKWRKKAEETRVELNKQADTPQKVLDDGIRMTTDCMAIAFSGDEEGMKECDKRGAEIVKRWEAVLKDMSDEEKAEWERKQQEALIEALDMGGMTPK